MLTSTIVAVLIFLCFLFFIIYKRDVLMRIFTMDASLPANELQEQLERTADTVVRRLEDKIAHLEYLLDEADVKIAQLEKCIESSEDQPAAMPQNVVPPAPVQIMSAYKTASLADSLEKAAEHEPASQEESAEGVPNDKKRVVLAMAEQGYNVTEIAKVLSIGKGEVMLLLQLSKAGK